MRETLLRHRAHPRHAAFAITVAATGEVVGNIALVSGDWSTGVAEAMYWIAAAWRGRGFSSAALRAVLRVGVSRAWPAPGRACDRPRQPALAADRRGGRFRDRREGAGTKGREP